MSNKDQSSKLKKVYFTELDIFNVYSNKFNLKKNEFLLIVRAFFALLGHEMIASGKIYYIPPFLGTLSVRKLKATSTIMDWNLYKQYGIKRKSTNFHSAGLVAKFKWETKTARFKSAHLSKTNLFSFKPARPLARYLASKIKLNNTINKYYDYN